MIARALLGIVSPRGAVVLLTLLIGTLAISTSMLAGPTIIYPKHLQEFVPRNGKDLQAKKENRNVLYELQVREGTRTGPIVAHRSQASTPVLSMDKLKPKQRYVGEARYIGSSEWARVVFFTGAKPNNDNGGDDLPPETDPVTPDPVTPDPVTPDPVTPDAGPKTPAPCLTLTPSDLIVEEGASINLRAIGGCDPQATFDWVHENGVTLSTSDSWSVDAMPTRFAGKITINLTGSAGVSTKSFVLSVRTKPEPTDRPKAPCLLVPPDDVVAREGTLAKFIAVLSCGEATTTIWTNAAGVLIGTSAILEFNSVAPIDAGWITFVAKGPGGTVTAKAHLTVVPKPEPLRISEQPRSQEAVEGRPVEFRVEVMGAKPLTFQWLRQGIPVPGATTTELRLPAADSALAGSFSVIVRDAIGQQVESEPAKLVVLASHLNAWIAEPEDGTELKPSAGLKVRVETADENGEEAAETITKAQLFDGHRKIAETSAGPLTFQFSSLTPGSHTLSVRLINRFGRVFTTDPVKINVTVPSHEVRVEAEHARLIRIPNLPEYPEGAIVSLQVVPDEGYRFRGWSGDAQGTAPQLQLVVDRNLSIVAQMEVIPAPATVQMTLLRSLSDGSTALTLKGCEAGAVYIVEISEDLEHWVTWKEAKATGDVCVLWDEPGSVASQRFYRFRNE